MEEEEEVEVTGRSVTAGEVKEESVTVMEEGLQVKEEGVTWMYEEVQEEDAEAQEKQAGREVYTLDIPDFLLPDRPEGDSAGEPFIAVT